MALHAPIEKGITSIIPIPLLGRRRILRAGLVGVFQTVTLLRWQRPRVKKSPIVRSPGVLGGWGSSLSDPVQERPALGEEPHVELGNPNQRLLEHVIKDSSHKPSIALEPEVPCPQSTIPGKTSDSLLKGVAVDHLRISFWT